MQYLLTQEELDALKDQSNVNVEKVFQMIIKHLVVRKACLDTTIGTETLIPLEALKVAFEKTREHYATK